MTRDFHRLISEDLLRLLPDFRRQSRNLFFALLLTIMILFGVEVLQIPILAPGAYLFSTYIWSAIFVSLLFILAHIPSKIEQFHYPPALIIIALLAAALIFLRIRYRSLWPGILLHMLWNSSGFLLLLWHW